MLIRCFSLAFPLMAWSGVASGILYVYRVFWLSAIAQLLPNSFVILTVFVAGRELGVGALALGILLGYVAMLGLFSLVLIRISRDSSIKLSSWFKLYSREGLMKALHLSVPLIATIFIGQWGIVIINRALSEMPPGTLAEFGYAWKLLALIGLLPAGLATVIFPAFSDAHARDNLAEFSRLVTRAYRMTLLLTLPLVAVLLVERIPLVSLMFGRGGMTTRAVAETGQLFGILLVGAPAGALNVALCKVAFSMQDTKSPMVVALISAMAITAFVPLSARISGVTGVAWAYSIITCFSTLIFVIYQIVGRGIVAAGEILKYFGMLLTLSLGIALPVMLIRDLFAAKTLMKLSAVLPELVLAGFVFVLAGYGLSRLLGIRESAEIASYLKWQSQQIPVFRKLK